MSKKSVIIVLLIMLLVVSGVSIYSTFAFDEEVSELDKSNADYNLIYSIKNLSDKQVSVAPKETKYVDISLQNTYSSTVKYGMYYYLISPNKMPDNVRISLSEDSNDSLQDTIKQGESRSISLKIVNDSDYSIDMIIGALVGFENGNIEDLVKDGEILIK